MRLRALILLPFLLGLSSFAVKSQPTATLQPGVPIERSLAPGQVHEFTVNAKENCFVQLVVEQKGIDVVVKIASPDGKALSECDTPNGDEGTERVSFIAKEAGKYRVSISPLSGDESTTGQYQIKLIEVREATEEEIEAGKNREEAKAKGIALLLDLRDAIAQIKSPSTRINAQLTAANLLHEHDEKGAAKYLTDAVTELKELFATADSDEDAEDSMAAFTSVSQLRTEVIRLLAETDPDAALSFLYSTAPKYSPYGNQRELVNQESGLELSIVDQIARKDPNRALKIARQNLKKTYSPALINTASQLAEKNPELATELMHDIAGKILAEEKLMTQIEAANLALALTAYRNGSENRVEAYFRHGVAFVPEATVAAPQKSRPSLLSEQDYKQLVQKMVREVLSYSQGSQNNGQVYPYGDALWTIMGGLRSLGPELDKIVTGSIAALDKKQKELTGNFNNQVVNQFQEFSNLIANNPVESALEGIEKAPAELREQLYVMLATKEAGNGDLNRAKQILNDHVSNPFQRSQALKSFEQLEIDHAMSSGKIEEALRNIGAMRSLQNRAEQLVQLAPQIGSSQKRATALNLLEQARSLLPPSPQAADQMQMFALLEIARAFSPYDSKRSFEMVDPLVDQFNDLCTAARTLEGFGFATFDYDELDIENEGSLAEIAGHLSEVLGRLALINFERAKASSDKLRLPEVRLHAYLAIAEQTITGQQQAKTEY